MGTDTTIDERALAWRGLVLKLRESLGMTESDVPLYVTLALIANESSGNPAAINGKYRGLLQIGPENAIDVENRVPEQFNGANPGVQPLGAEGDLPVPNPERVAAENSIIHFCEYVYQYRERIGGDPYRMAMCWKAGPGAVRRFNDAVGPPTQISAGSSNGLAFFRNEENKSDDYLNDILRLFPEAQEKLGQSPTLSQSTISGSTITARASDRSPYENSLARISTTIPASPGCAPGARSRFIPPSSERLELASSVRTKMLQASEITYISSIETFIFDTEARVSAGQKGYTKRAVTNIKSFRQEVENEEESSVAGALRAAFAFTPSNFVKPLEVFNVRRAFGENRSNLPNGAKIQRKHLGVDLETRDPAEVARKARTAQFIVNAQKPPRKLFGQKPVYAIADGEVIRAALRPFYGLVIYLDHGGGVTSRYAHLSHMSVSVGDFVKKAQPIAISGTTEEEGARADSGGTGRPDHSAVRIPHLHFEIRINIGALRGRPTNLINNVNNVALDPAAVLAQAPGPLDPPRMVQRPEEEVIDEGRGIQASLVMNAETDHGRLKNEEAYDAITALQRAQKVRNMGRADYYAEQSRVAPITRNVQEQAVRVDVQAHASIAAQSPEAIES